MRYREMHEQDVTEIFAIRTSTRENCLTMEDLKGRGITPESVSYIMQNDAKGWVCDARGEISGFAMGNGLSGEMLVLAVRPKYEGKGIGRTLMHLVQDWLFSQGHHELWLLENPDPSLRCYGFYRQLGWVPTGEFRAGERVLKITNVSAIAD